MTRIERLKKQTQINDDIVRQQYNTITLIEEMTLSDNSKVYNLRIGNVEIACVDRAQALRMYNDIEDIVAKAFDVSLRG